MDSTDADMMDSGSPQPPPPPPPSPTPSNSNQVDGVRGLLAFARHLIDQGKPSQALQAVVMAMRSEGGEEAVFQFLNRARASSAADELASLFAECAIAEALPSATPDSIQPSISSGFQIANMSQVSSAGRPPLSSSSFKRKCSSMDDSHNKCANSSGRCHCSMKRKSRMKRVVRVPAISLKMADIPPDDYSWRKYGQKPIKGSPHQRVYYKCSSLRGCPARKHVERALNDPNMLIVTYEGEHDHSHSVTDSPARPQLAIVLESS